MPFELTGNVLKVAVTDPTNLAALGALEFLSQKANLKVEIYITSFASFTAISRKSGNLTREVSQALQEVQKKEQQDEDEKSHPCRNPSRAETQ